MFDEMIAVLQDRVEPSVGESMMALAQALDLHDAYWYRDRVVDLYNSANLHSDVELVDQVREILDVQVKELMRQMGITLDTDHLTLDRQADLVRILVLEPSDLDEEALAALEQAGDSADALGEVVSVYLNTDPIEWMEALSDVEDNTIAAIREVLQANISYSDQPEADVQTITAKLHGYQKQLGTTPTVALESLHQGVRPGFDPDGLVRDRIGSLTSLGPDRLADELIAIAIMGNVPTAALRIWVLSTMEKIIDDPLAMQKGYRQVNSRLSEMEESP